MYLAMRLFRIQSAEEEYEKEKKQREKEGKRAGLIAYASPLHMEYTVFPSEETARFKAYIRSTPFPGDVLRKAAKKGFPLYFQLFESPWTKGEICGILNNDAGKIMANKPIIHCFYYDQVVHLALCLSRNIIFPKETPPSPYYLEIKEKFKEASDRQEKKRLRRELKKHSPIFDPYPKCRSCIMARKLIQESCLGAEFDIEDKECLECPSRKECCQLMRLRIEKILEGSEDQVASDIIGEWKEVNKRRKEVKKEMAKTKRKAEEVSEEVVEDRGEREEKRKKKKRKREEEVEGATLTKAQKRAERRKRKKEEEEEEEKPRGKKERGKRGKESSKVAKLLRELQEAKDEKDQDLARKIRADLRKEGYSLRAHANE